MSSKRGALLLSTGEKSVLWCVLIILVGSILPWTLSPFPRNAWNSSNLFMLGIGIVLPIIYAVLLSIPKFSAWLRPGEGEQPGPVSRKIGSLSVRQFGQVSAWLSLSYFVIHLLTTLSPMLLIGTVGASGLVLVTVLDRQIFGEQIQPDPTPPQPEQTDNISGIRNSSSAQLRKTTGGIPVIDAVDAITQARQRKTNSNSQPVISAERSADFDQQKPQHNYPASEAFWFAVHHSRPVVDEQTGKQLFTAEPGTWILALTERADGFVVRSDAGVVGLMKDVENIERA